MSARLNLMYVDDDADIREVVEFALEDEADIALRLCPNGPAALAAAAADPPELILLDVMMPGMDGPTVLQRLRDAGCAAPVVFMTAKVQTHDVERLRALGAAGVIAKPFDPLQLAAQIRQYLPPRS
jgi:two-component system OmpR family response regulator